MKGHPKVLQMVRIKKRIERGVQVRKDDAGIGESRTNVAIPADSFDEIDGVQRKPADYEEKNDYRKVLSRLHFFFSRCT